MYTLEIIYHSLASNADIDSFIRIKSIAWPYPYNTQLKWIKEHLKNSDLHLLLLKDGEMLAYLNLIEIEIEINGKLNISYGVGNVCTIEKGKRYGSELMRQTNDLIQKRERIGLLFCKKELVSFYKKHNWILLNNQCVFLTFEKKNIETMVFNYSGNINKIKYNGNSF